MPLPKKLQNKKAIIYVQNRDNHFLRWALRAALFPARNGAKVTRPSSYPTEDGLNFTGIDFPTPVLQIDRLERQNPNLAINVFGWENEQVVVHRISEKCGELPRINLMITMQGENTHYSYVKRFARKAQARMQRTAEKPNQNGDAERSLENKMAFKNYYKQMKAPYVVYADFECVFEKG